MPLVDTLRSWARRIKRDSVTLWFAGKHADTPFLPKAICLLVVLYALSPIDLIPDFIPVLGYVDDVLLLPALIWLAVRLLPPPVLAECREKAAEWMAREGRKPRNPWGILFVLATWTLFAWLLWRYLPSLTQ